MRVQGEGQFRGFSSPLKSMWSCSGVYKNGWTDREAHLGADSLGPKELCIRCGSRSFMVLAAKRIIQLSITVCSRRGHSILSNNNGCESVWYLLLFVGKVNYCESSKLKSFHEKQLFEFRINGVQPSPMYVAFLFIFLLVTVAEKEFMHRMWCNETKYFTWVCKRPRHIITSSQ